MHRHYGTNNRAPRWTFMDLCKLEVSPGAREESASPAWLAAPAMNAMKVKSQEIAKSLRVGRNGGCNDRYPSCA